MNVKETEAYQNKFKYIPKDYLERINYLFEKNGYTNYHVDTLFSQIENLTQNCWEELNYIFYMNPKATPRPKLNPRTHTFYVKDAKNTKDVFDEFITRHSKMEFVISTPCKISTKIYMETPKGMNKMEALAAELELTHHVVSPDWDNLGKTYSDMIQSTLINNDSIICKSLLEKFYSILPRIEIQLKFMTKYDCRYNKRAVESRKSFKENSRTIKSLEYII